MKRLIGTVAALASMGALTSAMLPLRAHLSIATTALILVVPVVIGVVTGGFVAGVVSVAVGFLVYDFFFIPPYLTLWVGAPQNWVALGVYVIVMLPVAKVVAGMNEARANERRHSKEIRQLFELSDLLVGDKPLDVLLSVIVTTLADVFGSRQVALLLPQNGRPQIVASAGDPLSDEQLSLVLPSRGSPTVADAESFERGGLLVLALSAAGRPVGLLVLSSETAAQHEREPLLLFANQIALAVERAQLREEALRAQLTEEVARLSRTLVAAVSHDLRAPLASIRASSSTLSDTDLDLSPEDRQKLTSLIDAQAGRLANLVQSLLDMSRIQAGVLEPRRSVLPLEELVTSVVNDLTPAARGHSVDVLLADDLPPIDVDLVLITRVLANLLENAFRHGPKNTVVTIRAARLDEETIELSVEDAGPGVSPDRRNEIFGLFMRRDGDAGAGLGLAIAKTFVEAHGERIWVEDAPAGGARFCLTLPVAAPILEEARIAEHSDH
ncbi:MAG: ATP-binding protein [Acidimicrobiales bacterium]|jgi:two-component system sensor histidine kinase KdpD